MDTNQAAPIRILALDGIRGICALMVALFHLPLLSHFYSIPLIRNGYLFVDFFFVLSGCVISFAYSKKLTKKSHFLPFILKRLARLWPLHILILSLFLLVSVFNNLIANLFSVGVSKPILNSTSPESYSDLLYQFFLLHGTGIAPIPSWNYPSWSISCEFIACVTFGLVNVFIKSKKIIVYAIISGVSLIIVYFFASEFMGTTNKFGMFRCLSGFYLGCITFEIYRTWFTEKLRVGWLEILLVFVALGFVWFCPSGPMTMLSPFIFSVFVFFYLPQIGNISKYLSKPFFLKLGEASYSIYLIHYFFVFLFLGITTTLLKDNAFSVMKNGKELNQVFSLGGPFVSDALTLFYLALVLISSIYLFKLFENPVKKWLYTKITEKKS